MLFLLKVSKVQVSTRHYQEKMVAEALDLLLKHYNIFPYSIAFPELVLPTKLALKKYKNTTHIHRVRKQVSVFLERIERNVTFIQVLNPLKDTLGHFSHFHGLCVGFSKEPGLLTCGHGTEGCFGVLDVS